MKQRIMMFCGLSIASGLNNIISSCKLIFLFRNQKKKKFAWRNDVVQPWGNVKCDLAMFFFRFTLIFSCVFRVICSFWRTFIRTVFVTSAVEVFSGVSAREGEVRRNGTQQLNDVSYVIWKTINHNHTNIFGLVIIYT